jgi:hypothetical protein
MSIASEAQALAVVEIQQPGAEAEAREIEQGKTNLDRSSGIRSMLPDSNSVALLQNSSST